MKKKRARKASVKSDADGHDAAGDDVAEDADEREHHNEHLAALSKVGFDVAHVVELSSEEYEFDDLQLRGEMKVKEARLRGAMTVMEGQIGDLERERLHLLKQLRHTAMNISEQGVKFVGLDAEQLRLVQDTAIDLKAGGDGAGGSAMTTTPAAARWRGRPRAPRTPRASCSSRRRSTGSRRGSGGGAAARRCGG